MKNKVQHSTKTGIKKKIKLLESKPTENKNNPRQEASGTWERTMISLVLDILTMIFIAKFVVNGLV
jgi:hypothetical protein